MPALKRLTTLLLAPVVALGLFVVAAPSASAATSTLAWGGYKNGYIPASALCSVPWQTSERLRCDATTRLVALNKAYKAKWGANLCVNDSYRSYAGQVKAFATYGSPRAAKPGTSTHGWGLAIDLGCGMSSFTAPKHRWFTATAPKYGWTQPAWAKATGSNPEPWHWQYVGTTRPIPAPPAPAPSAPITKAATTATIAITGTWPRTATVTLRSRTTGKVLAGAVVKIAQRGIDETAFTAVETVRTDAAGKASYRYTPYSPSVVRFSYAGSATTKAVTATATLTTPTQMSGTFVRDRRGSYLLGRLTTPDDGALAGETVLVQRRSGTSTTWTTVATLTTNDRGYVWSEVQREQDTWYRFSYAGRAGQYEGDVSRDADVGYRDGSRG